MKRSGIQRRTPMKSGSSLRSSTPQADTSGKPAKRKTGPSKATLRLRTKKLVSPRSGGDCEIRTPWCLGRATNLSHRLAEGQGGQWSAVNCLDSCGHGNASGCHGYLHQHPAEARRFGWMVDFSADPAAVEVLMWHDGRQDWFLLREDGTAELAPFPEGRPEHPDDLDLRGESRDLGGVA